MGSVMPAEHPAWDDPEVTSKNFTADGSEKAAQILNVELGGVTTACEYDKLSRKDMVKH